jgi:PTS system ascorbate-specific IIA component
MAFRKEIKTNLSELLDKRIKILDSLNNDNSNFTAIEHCFNEAVGLLIDAGYAEERYADEVIKNLREFGPYMVYTEAYTAMPHARPEQGVLKTGIALIKLNTPVIFEHSEIYFIFALASENTDGHMAVISAVSELMNNRKALDFLKEAKTVEEIKKVLSKFEAVMATGGKRFSLGGLFKKKPAGAAKSSKKTVKVITICGNGLGSSLMLAGNIEKLFAENPLDNVIVQAEAKDFSSAKQSEADLYVSVIDFIRQLDDKDDSKKVAVKAYHILSDSEKEDLTAKIRLISEK